MQASLPAKEGREESAPAAAVGPSAVARRNAPAAAYRAVAAGELAARRPAMAAAEGGGEAHGSVCKLCWAKPSAAARAMSSSEKSSVRALSYIFAGEITAGLSATMSMRKRVGGENIGRYCKRRRRRRDAYGACAKIRKLFRPDSRPRRTPAA